MNPRTERKLRAITADVAKKCGIEKALVDRPDPQQEENKQKAREVIARTQAPNNFTAEQINTLRKQMTAVLDEPVRMVKQLDPVRQKQYDFLLEKRIKAAIRAGEIPNPTSDPDFKKITKLFGKK